MITTVLGFSEPMLVVTAPGGQTGLVYPVGPVFEATAVKLVRVNLFLQSLTVASSNLVVEAGLQTSDDATTWPTSTTTPSFLSSAVTRNAEGYTATTAFEDISSILSKRYARWVFWVKNISPNTALSTCLAAIRVEKKSC